MTYKIIGDSCLDLTEELKKDPVFLTIPLTLQVDDTQVIDDESFDQAAFLKLVKSSPNCPKTACPSPESFKQAYCCEEENVFVITLSEHLSGTFNAAMVAKEMYEEEFGPKNIAVISSHSASSGQLNMALKIRDLAESGMDFDQILKAVYQYRREMGTYFVLESLDVLRKNGRLTGLQAFFATALNIKPIMSAEEGVITKLEQARGINKALARMTEIAIKNGGDTSQKRLIIAHCNNPERAAYVKSEMEKKASFKEVLITETAGVSTVYASDGGIIMTL